MRRELHTALPLPNGACHPPLPARPPRRLRTCSTFEVRYEDGSTARHGLLDTTFTLLPAEEPRKEPDPGEERVQCLVCCAAPRSVMFLPCKHVAVCAACGAQDSVRRRCPWCKQPISRLISGVYIL